MNCKEFMQLDTDEQCILVGRANHLLRTDPDSFRAIASMVRSAEQRGLFFKVKFGKEVYQDEPQNEN